MTNKNKNPYHSNIEKLVVENTDFRQVLYTAPHSQLVIMSLLPSEEIGMEVHKNVDQFFRFEIGEGKAIINGQEFTFKAGDVAIVPAGAEHNFINTGIESLKLYTIYAPPNHIDGRIHHTKADAEADTADEDFGNAQ